nr:uncharacterized protein LOC112013620 [Quercus suber]
MRILSWNCRGLRTPSAILQCQKKAQEYHPDIFFLMETRLAKDKGEAILQRCGFWNGWEHPREGLSGGLLVGWLQNLKLDIQYSSKHLIHANLLDFKGTGKPSRTAIPKFTNPINKLRDSQIVIGSSSLKLQLTEIGDQEGVGMRMKLGTWRAESSSQVVLAKEDRSFT